MAAPGEAPELTALVPSYVPEPIGTTTCGETWKFGSPLNQNALPDASRIPVDIPCADFWYLRDRKIETFNCYAMLSVMYAQSEAEPLLD